MSVVEGWVCPDCDRLFARKGQGHECHPAITLEEYFETADPWERPIFEAVLDHLESLGPIHVEPVSVGIFLKAPARVAQLRPMRKWVALGFMTPSRIEDARISRKPVDAGKGSWHVVNVTEPDQIDDVVKGWLTEAYLMAVG